MAGSRLVPPSIPAMPLDPARTVAELRELHELTGDEHGAQRVAFTDNWARARNWMREKLEELPVEIEDDAAGNRWATLEGVSDRAILIGGHIDSVPNGGWLDGALDLLAGLEVLRHLAEDGCPSHTIRLVDWADEEGARFGRSLFGSSAASGTLDVEEVRGLSDSDGISLADALAEHGIDLDRLGDARGQLEGAAAYLELHIEQGPVLEGLELPLGVVLGTFGLERTRVGFHGQPAHAGSTPMDVRRDALAAAARLVLELREIAKRGGDVGTVGTISARPGIVTAIPGDCELALDQRHLEASGLAAMVADARAAAESIAAEERVELAWRSIWAIDPIPFDPELIELGQAAVRELASDAPTLASGPLHDAAEAARVGVPTVMLFVQSLRGLSHAKEEDSRSEHLELAVEALDRLTAKTLAWVEGRP